jgi:hypothetical protein
MRLGESAALLAGPRARLHGPVPAQLLPSSLCPALAKLLSSCPELLAGFCQPGSDLIPLLGSSPRPALPTSPPPRSAPKSFDTHLKGDPLSTSIFYRFLAPFGSVLAPKTEAKTEQNRFKTALGSVFVFASLFLSTFARLRFEKWAPDSLKQPKIIEDLYSEWRTGFSNCCFVSSPFWGRLGSTFASKMEPKQSPEASKMRSNIALIF